MKLPFPELDSFIEEGVKKSHPELADYKYKDLPRMTPEYMQKFLDLVGEENIFWLTKANYGDTVRGQIMISPAGVERCREHAMKHKENEG